MAYSSYIEPESVKVVVSPKTTPSTDYVDLDWKKRQQYLDLLDDDDLTNLVKGECLHSRYHYGKTKLHYGPTDIWEYGLVCSTCSYLICAVKDMEFG